MNDETIKPKSNGFISRRAAKIVATLVAVVVLVAACSYGVYAWQQSKLTESLTQSNQKQADLEHQVSDLKKQVTTAQANYQKANSQLQVLGAGTDMPSQKDLTIKVDNAVRFNIQNSGNKPHVGVGVSVSIANPTSNSVALYTRNIKLKDSNDNVYLIITKDLASSAGNMPSGVPLEDQLLAPNEVVRGLLFYEVDDNTIMSFSLVNDVNAYPFKVS